MVFPTKQNPLDWITQYWNIVLGKKVDAHADAWLLGPIGYVKEDSNQFIERITKEKQLTVVRNTASSGLIESMDDWSISVSPKIAGFYLRTSDFEFTIQTAWSPIFGSLGYLIAKLFSRRIQQLNLPRDAKESSLTLESEIIKLIDGDGSVEYTIWRRSIRDTGEVVFFGIYTTCRIPSGEFCVKAVFPLPRGNATVIFRTETHEQGNLLLVSSGKKYGDPGFYFLVEDGQGRLWRHFLPSFRERILVSEGDDGEVKAAHTLKLWSFQVYNMIYSITEKSLGDA